MRVILRSTRTGHYFQTPEQWTDDLKTALDFGQIEQAINAACRGRLDDVEVVLCGEDPPCEVRLPLR